MRNKYIWSKKWRAEMVAAVVGGKVHSFPAERLSRSAHATNNPTKRPDLTHLVITPLQASQHRTGSTCLWIRIIKWCKDTLAQAFSKSCNGLFVSFPIGGPTDSQWRKWQQLQTMTAAADIVVCVYGWETGRGGCAPSINKQHEIRYRPS